MLWLVRTVTMYEQRQRRRRFYVFLVEALIIVSALGYVLFSLEDFKEEQEEKYTALEQGFQKVTGAYQQRLEDLKNTYEERLQDLALNLEEYSSKTENLVERVEETEEQSSLRLEALKQELRKVDSEDFSQLISELMKGAVSVSTEKNRGSGAVLTKDGFIVTNNHVTKNFEFVTVTDYHGRIINAKVVVRDPIRDIAILKSPVSFNYALKLGDSDNVKVGEKVIAIGSPERLDFTVTQGIVSATNRVFHKEEGSFIQTDVPINTGSSGGPLIDAEGHLIGINTFKIKGSESLGFAIPSKDVARLLGQAKEAAGTV